VVAGQLITTSGIDNLITNTDIFIACYNTNGSLDKTFNHKGWETSNFGYDNENAFALEVKSKDRIVMGCNLWNGNNTDFALAKYKAAS